MTQPDGGPAFPPCCVCDETGSFSWTDTHGIAQHSCGVPYRLYHYEGEKRVEKPPSCCLRPEFIPVIREFHRLYPTRIIPGGFSFTGGYERASSEDAEFFYSWIKEHEGALLTERQRREAGT